MSNRCAVRSDRLLKLDKNEYVGSIRSLLGYDWAMFYYLIGGRGRGKTFSVQEYFTAKAVNDGIPFYWLRIYPKSIQKLTSNNCSKFIDPIISRKYKLDLKMQGNVCYNKGHQFCSFYALSEMAKNKGTALFDDDYDGPIHIVLDEFNLETGRGGECVTQDLVYNFINTLETLIRTRKKNVKIFLMANQLEECSDILMALNFLPENYGIFKLKSKRSIVYNIKNSSAYLASRKGSASEILGGSTFSTFSNILNIKMDLLWKGRLRRPTHRIIMDKGISYIVYDNRVICEDKGQSIKDCAQLPMKPHLGYPFDKGYRQIVTDMFDKGEYMYRSVMLQKKFSHDLERVRSSR